MLVPRVDVADTRTLLYKPMGEYVRIPGLAAQNQQTHEYIHRSVYHLTFPYAPRPPRQDSPLSRWIYPPIIPPCKSLQDVPQPAANGNPARMDWFPIHQSRSHWPFTTAVTPRAANPITEMEALPEESALVGHWVLTAHEAAQSNSQSGDEGTNPFLTLLPILFPIPGWT